MDDSQKVVVQAHHPHAELLNDILTPASTCNE